MTHWQDLHVQDYFPHEYPFLLIDKVLYVEENRAVAVKNVTRSEPWFTGHFPNNPIFPGVLLLEAMAQTGRFLDSLHKAVLNPRLARIENVKFYQVVRPGDTVVMEAERIAHSGALYKFKTIAKVDDNMVAHATFWVYSPDAMEMEDCLNTSFAGMEVFSS